MLTLIGMASVAVVWILSTILSLSVSEGTKATKETIKGFKEMKVEWDV